MASFRAAFFLAALGLIPASQGVAENLAPLNSKIPWEWSTGQPQTTRVDVWAYVKGGTEAMETPGDHISQSPTVVSPDKVVYYRTDTLQVAYVRNIRLGRVNVLSDGATQGSANPWLRCFGETPKDCAAAYAPSSMPLFVDLPVLPASTVRDTSVNPQGRLMFAHRPFHANQIDMNSCKIVPGGGGPNNQSISAYIVDRFDFGGDIGARENVLVLEEVSGIPAGSPTPLGGQRMERYWFVQGLGYVREEGWEDPTCRANVSAATCTGSYTKAEPGPHTWSILHTTPVPVTEYCPEMAFYGPDVTQSGTTRPLFQFVQNGNYFFLTGDPAEGSRAGFAFVGNAFNVYPSDAGGTVPLYRCFDMKGDHFASADAGCEGYHREGLLGFVKDAPMSDHYPVYRMYNPTLGDHLISQDIFLGKSKGYKVEGILGYAPDF
jgi:hypothetical protein